jgi:small subunit ribosomal protein S16
MLKIRLQRTGRKNEPTFRLVLTDSKNSAKSGRFLEVLGNFDSRKGEKAEFKGERISHWMSVGAQVSDTVHNLLVDKKLVSGKKINKLPKKSAPVVVAEAPVVETTSEVKEEVKTPEEAPVEAASVEEVAAPKEEVAAEAEEVAEAASPEEAPVAITEETPVADDAPGSEEAAA